MVRLPRFWRGFRSGDQLHPPLEWTYESLDTDDAVWFARLPKTDFADRPAVVLVHGVVVSGTYFQPVARYLERDLDVFIPDLPGTGRSITRDGLWDIAKLADGLGRWMDHQEIQGAVLVSHSFGCQVITMLAANRPELAHSLILVAPTMDPAAKSVARIMARGLRDIPRERPGLWKVWITDAFRTGPLRGLRTLRMAMRDPQLERLAEIDTLAIVIGGENDPIVPAAWVETMANAFPNGRAVILPGAPHAMNYSRPRDIARIIRLAASSCGGS